LVFGNLEQVIAENTSTTVADLTFGADQTKWLQMENMPFDVARCECIAIFINSNSFLKLQTIEIKPLLSRQIG
jgi:hypothetical protein